MENEHDFTGGYLPLEPINKGYYKIISITIAADLDKLSRRLAIATVVNKNRFGLWDGNTLHNIELKHIYNKHSIGATTTPYTKLLGNVIHVIEIRPPTFGVLDIISWELIPNDIPLNYSRSEINLLYKKAQSTIKQWKYIL